MYVSVERKRQLLGTLAAMRNERLPFWNLWRELADYYLPKRYMWLLSDSERRVRNATNPFILDGTGTIAARTLASGMMNGVTSPARPWFRLNISGFNDDADVEARQWLDEVTRRMMLVFAESNFYNSLAVMYLDLVVFGTAANLIYEDYDSVIRCYNPCLGEYYLGQSDRQAVNAFGREFTYTVRQVVEWFGLENCSERVQAAYRQGGAQMLSPVELVHIIEPNEDGKSGVSRRFAYRETYWENGAQGDNQNQALILSEKGFNELPGIFPRWELSGNDSYGTSPGMDALGDVKQLQHETKRKAQGLDKMVSPPLLVDVQLRNSPVATLPNGLTYVTGLGNSNTAGARPAYQVQVPIDALTIDIREVQGRIRETFNNDLFKMISQLETVRSATEIDARKEEKLVLLGPVLERFENEALDPGINRVYNIMQRAKLLPEPPARIANQNIEVQYISILSVAQRSLSVVPTERFLQLIGGLATLYPKIINVPNFEELVRDYGDNIGVAAKGLNPRAVTEIMNKQADALASQREAAGTASALAQGAQTLSQTDVGGGANAAQLLLGR